MGKCCSYVADRDNAELKIAIYVTLPMCQKIKKNKKNLANECKSESRDPTNQIIQKMHNNTSREGAKDKNSKIKIN